MERDRRTASAPQQDLARLGALGEATLRRERDVLVVHLSGDWALEDPTPDIESLVESLRPETGRAGAIHQGVTFDTAALGEWDSSLLVFLLRVESYCAAHDLVFHHETLPESLTRLLELARAVPEVAPEPETAQLSLLGSVGASGISSFDGALASVTFLGRLVESLMRLVSFRVRMHWRDFWAVVQSNSAGALPLVTLISFLVGLIIAFLGAVVLRRFGAGYFVSYLVGYGMLREMGALMTGIIMAGRTGAAFAAELGSMKITEEVDALETVGISPVDHLVLPRVLGVFVTMPLLTVYSMFVGLVGGLLVAVTMLDLTAGQFVSGLLTPLTLSDGLLGVFKGTVFGLIIGVTGCMRGMQAGSDAGAVGRAATSAVVTGITLIILANAVIDWLAALLNV